MFSNYHFFKKKIRSLSFGQKFEIWSRTQKLKIGDFLQQHLGWGGVVRGPLVVEFHYLFFFFSPGSIHSGICWDLLIHLRHVM